MLPTATTWLVIVLHYLFCLGETVGWSTMGASFGLPADAIETTRDMALNQGAYNAGLATVLAWAERTGRTETVLAMLMYVLAMAVVGALSVKWTILLVQGVPAMIALAAVWRSR